MKKLSRKHFALVLALSIITLIGWGCDGGGGAAGVCTENIRGIGQTSAARLYYPCNISAPTGATTMTGGFMETLDYVSWLSNDIANSGYVVLAFTPTNIMGMVNQWKNAHKNSINKLREINNNHSKLRGMIDLGKLQTCGHSKGGGGALWASAELGGQLKTTIGMAPWMEGFNAGTLRTVSSATLIQAGGSDSLAVASMTRSEYNGLGNIPKCYAQYPGYGHMAWAMASGAQADTLSGDILDWMDYYMNGQGSRPARCN